MATDAEKQRAEELGNSRNLDVHKWSDYPEVNKAVATVDCGIITKESVNISN